MDGSKQGKFPPPWAAWPVGTVGRGQSACKCKYKAFFHHYQGSIDFNTVNIHRTVGMYFLVSTGNRGDIE